MQGVLLEFLCNITSAIEILRDWRSWLRRRLESVVYGGSDVAVKASVQNAFDHVRTVSFFSVKLQHMASSLAASLSGDPPVSVITLAGALWPFVLGGYSGVGSRRRGRRLLFGLDRIAFDCNCTRPDRDR